MSKIWSISVSILTIIIILSISNDIINNNITFCLNGEKNYEILVNTEYKDEGIIANIFNKNISNKVKITSNLNINKIGSYYIKYNLKYFLNNYKLKRTILVNDKEQPSIKLDGETELSLYVGDIYQESGAIAIDNYDGDITDKIIISGTVDTSKVGTYELKYTIKDSSGNENFVIRKIIVKKKIVKPTTNYNCVKYSDNYNNDDPVIRYIKDNNYRVSVGYYN